MPGLSNTLGLVGDRPADEIIRRLTLDVSRRLDGMLHGDFMGIVPGRGSEPGETRRYSPGDDVRHIDWNVTARMQEPYIRETIADRELETWMVIDRSPRLDFGTASCEKRDLVLGAAAAIGLLTARGGNRVGAMIMRGPQVATIPPRQGRRNLLGVLNQILTAPRVDGAGSIDLGAGLRALGSMAPRRGPHRGRLGLPERSRDLEHRARGDSPATLGAVRTGGGSPRPRAATGGRAALHRPGDGRNAGGQHR